MATILRQNLNEFFGQPNILATQCRREEVPPGLNCKFLGAGKITGTAGLVGGWVGVPRLQGCFWYTCQLPPPLRCLLPPSMTQVRPDFEISPAAPEILPLSPPARPHLTRPPFSSCPHPQSFGSLGFEQQCHLVSRCLKILPLRGAGLCKTN